MRHRNVIQPRNSSEFWDLSHDVERCVARNMPMTLNWSARDAVLVYERHRVPNFKDLGRPCFVCNGFITSNAQYRLREYM